ncbi:HAD-IA family hydrolase [bacterium]|nr:HAD-IA family hydrolase [bacterium]
MHRIADEIDAILFDYGNTLIEFGPAQVDSCDRALSAELVAMFGPHDFARLNEIQHRERRAPYSGEFLENDLITVTRDLIRSLFGVEATEPQLEHLLDVRFHAMTSAVSVDPAVHQLLKELHGRYRLGLISNYPCARSINHSLAEHQLNRWFEVVVVSGDVGRVKPHPQIFEQAVMAMQLDPQRTLFVGDNWLGDIQGAKRCGMKAVWTKQYVPYEKFDAEPDHFDADFVIEHLDELRGLL